jgi:hypothetical protein
MFNNRIRIGVDDNSLMSPTDTLAADLKEVFGDRLRMIAAFGADSQTCAVVDSLTLEDLDRCAAFGSKWKKLGLEAPLLLDEPDLARSLDAFPLEFSEIITTRRLVDGRDLFEHLTVAKGDLRRACEVQARGHVMHLREGYIEAAGDGKAVSRLVAAAIPPFRALVTNTARLDGIAPKALVTQLQLENFEKGFPEALSAAQRLVDYVDRWAH